jgi:hypothetical protein
VAEEFRRAHEPDPLPLIVAWGGGQNRTYGQDDRMIEDNRKKFGMRLSFRLDLMGGNFNFLFWEPWEKVPSSASQPFHGGLSRADRRATAPILER